MWIETLKALDKSNAKVTKKIITSKFKDFDKYFAFSLRTSNTPKEDRTKQ